MVQDRQPAISTWTVSHILITYPENATAKDSAGTKAAAQEAYRAIRNGMDFEAAVKKYCTDEGLTLNGGKMDPFPSGRFEGDFMAPLYKTEENEITPPFETRYGPAAHIGENHRLHRRHIHGFHYRRAVRRRILHG